MNAFKLLLLVRGVERREDVLDFGGRGLEEVLEKVAEARDIRSRGLR